MMKQHLPILTALTAALIIVNFYVFSRFTADDAFITWRYGKNLIEHGIWAYNPTRLDITQAYTNPLFAALSLVPAASAIDTVLFFKITSILSAGALAAYMGRLMAWDQAGIACLALFFAMPTVMIHLFSGLETFVYGAALGLAFINIHRRSAVGAAAFVLIALLCRPEAWLWTALLPAAFLTKKPREGEGKKSADATPQLLSKFHLPLITIVPGLALGMLFLLHKTHFGYFLPNTFYAKSGTGADFSITISAKLLILSGMPLALAVAQNKRLAALLALGFYAPVIYNYSKSELLMNYSWRFAFQLFMPSYLYATYLISAGRHITGPEAPNNNESASKTWAPRRRVIALAASTLPLVVATSSKTELSWLVNYYPRLLNAHATLGHALNTTCATSPKTSFLLGDAGVAAFHSDAIALDNVGLASSQVAHHGVTRETLELYNPEHIFLYASPGGPPLQRFGSNAILQWASEERMGAVCDIILSPSSSLRYYSKTGSTSIIDAAASSSARNNLNEWQFLRAQLPAPPWTFWVESL